MQHVEYVMLARDAAPGVRGQHEQAVLHIRAQRVQHGVRAALDGAYGFHGGVNEQRAAGIDVQGGQTSHEIALCIHNGAPFFWG